MNSTKLFTQEYLDLCAEFVDFRASPPKPLRGGSTYIYASTYATYTFCPFSLGAEQAKQIFPIPVTIEEKAEDRKEAKKRMDYGKDIHNERALRLVREVPNTTVTTESLGYKSLATKRKAQEIVASVVNSKLVKLTEQHPKTAITESLVRDLESEAISKDPSISRKDKATILGIDSTEGNLTSKPIAGSLEQPLVLLHKGIWFSGKLDGVFFKDGKIALVDEFKTSADLSKAKRYVAQSELYCLMLSRATGQTDFPYTLSLGKEVPELFPIRISGDWDESRILRNLDSVVDYYTRKIEADFPGDWDGRCQACSHGNVCLKREVWYYQKANRLYKERIEKRHLVNA